MKELRFEYRDGVEFVNWVGDTNEAGSSSVAHLRDSQPGTWALCEAAYQAWKAETTKPPEGRKKATEGEDKDTADKAAPATRADKRDR